LILDTDNAFSLHQVNCIYNEDCWINLNYNLKFLICFIVDTPVGTSLSAGGGSTSGGDDIFSSFLSASTAASSTVSSSPSSEKKDTDGTKGRSAEEESFFNQPAPSSQEKRQLTKDSILALYSAAPSQAQAGNPATLYGIPGIARHPTVLIVCSTEL
jgi:hypothetical protein